MLEGNHFDAHFGLILAEQILRVIGPVEIFALAVLAGAGMVAAHDEVGDTVIFADQPMPDGFARAGHAHGKAEQRHGCGCGRIFVQYGLIAAHSGKVIHVARFRHADDGVDQEVGLSFLCGPESEFLMRPVQGIARLERHDAAPAHLAEIGAQFVRGVAARAEIVVNRLLDACDRPAQINIPGSVVQIVDSRMCNIIRAKDFLGLTGFVGGVFRGH